MSDKKRGVSPEELALLLPTGKCTVYRWIRDDLIPYVNKQIPLVYALKMKLLWDKTCTASEAARILGVSTSKVNDMLDDGYFQEILVARKKRILRKSIHKVMKVPFVIQKQDIIYPNRRGFARLRKAKQREISMMGNNSNKRKRFQID
jgi:hypothetical protein